jgi:pilus assembly protein Flp/PilA
MLDPIIHLILMTRYRVQDRVARSRNQNGATAVEYGLLVSLIAGAIVISVTLLGTKLSGFFNTMASKI